MDLAAPEGSPIYAVTDGEVVEVNEEAMNIDGNHVMHTLPDGTIIYCGHMRDVPLVKKGDKVKKAKLIGYVGQTGQQAHIFTFERRKTKVFQYGTAEPYIHYSRGYPTTVGMVIDPKTQKVEHHLKNKSKRRKMKTKINQKSMSLFTALCLDLCFAKSFLMVLFNYGNTFLEYPF